MPRVYQQLDLDERRTIFRMLNAKVPVAGIARQLGRHRSTIHREIHRNHFREQREYAGYFPLTAQERARQRRQRLSKLCRHEALRHYVIDKLERCWSPKQIAGRLKLDSPSGDSVCHETIYQYIYGPEGRAAGLYRHLPKARRQRRPRYGRKPRASFIPAARAIAQRPPEAEDRQTFGHWEADLLIFRREHGKANLTTMVERHRRAPTAAVAPRPVNSRAPPHRGHSGHRVGRGDECAMQDRGNLRHDSARFLASVARQGEPSLAVAIADQADSEVAFGPKVHDGRFPLFL